MSLRYQKNLSSSHHLAYPFQMVVADLFHNGGHQYLAYADTLTGWLEISYYQSDPNSYDIVDTFRELFQRYGVPEEISLDGGPNITSKAGTCIRLSSAYYPKSNGWAELAVKTSKRLIEGNTGKNGTLKTNRLAQSLLQYRNTPLKVGNKSPSQLLFGRSLRNRIPQTLTHYRISQYWVSYLRQRERELFKTVSLTKSITIKV